MKDEKKIPESSGAQVVYMDEKALPLEDDKNPRKISKSGLEKLKKSLKDNADFFEARPILINKREDGSIRIIGGHQRLKAARELRIEKVPCYVFEGLSEEREKYYTVLDNDQSGRWDFGLLQDFGVVLDDFSVSVPSSVDYNKIVTNDVLNAIIYKPSEIPAKVSEFVDDEEYQKVVKAIEGMEIPDELREFVDMRLQFFKRINFDKVADYYARADEKVRLLFRQLALVFDVSGTTFEKDVFDLYNIPLNDPNFYDE